MSYIPWESRDVVLIVFGESTFLVANDSFRFMDQMLEAGSIGVATNISHIISYISTHSMLPKQSFIYLTTTYNYIIV